MKKKAMHETVFENVGLGDLNPILTGNERCAPSHSFGPAIRGYFLLHYVMGGKGIFYKNGKPYPVKAGEAFLILPDEITAYTADSQDPWQYAWIGFDGALAEKFKTLPPVFPLPVGLLQEIFGEQYKDATQVYELTAVLFRLYAYLFSESKEENRYVKRVEDYIHALYMQSIRVEDIAAGLNLDRRYLSRLFKAQKGVSILEYLISVRMKEAARLLERGATVKEASCLCGYGDVSNFSKMFKRKYGVSPCFWRKERGKAPLSLHNEEKENEEGKDK
ncbi:MAG: AraC family transcriptional regulator [Clostridia bacterium]|nr:AraC family transcriptional regulator [Clostridia bacterium]